MSQLRDFRVLAALGKGSYGSVSKVERATDGQVRAGAWGMRRRQRRRQRRVGGGGEERTLSGVAA